MFIYLNEPNNEYYTKLIEIAFSVCNKFAFIRHSQLSYLNTIDLLIEELKEEFIFSKEQSVWPGTVSVPTAIVYYFRSSEKAKKLILSTCNSLFDWKAPRLPDDLCFFKEDKEWLITTSHEYICYIKTDDILELKKIEEIQGLIFSVKE